MLAPPTPPDSPRAAADAAPPDTVAKAIAAEARALSRATSASGAAAVALAERAAAERAANPRRSCGMPTATSTSAAAAAIGPTGCPFSPTRQCSGFPGGPTFDPLNLATTTRRAAALAPPSRCRAISRRAAGRRSEKVARGDLARAATA